MAEYPGLRHRIVNGVLFSLSLLPWSLLTFVGATLGRLAYVLARRPRRCAMINVSLCFPALSLRERRKLVFRHFVAMGETIFGGVRLWWAPASEIRQRIRYSERTSYDNAAREGRNIILLAPHFIGLEIGGLLISLDTPCVSMYRPFDTVLANVIQRRRERFGIALWRNDGPLRALVRSIQTGKPFYYLPDINPGDADAVDAPFFGIPTPTLTALARIARLTNAVVLPCFTRKLPGTGGFEVIIRPALANFPTGDPLVDATCMNAAIEEGIRLIPDQYLWTYKRFKNLTVNGVSVYRR